MFQICGSNPNASPLKIKTTEQHFPLVLFDMLYKVFLTFVSVTIQMKAISAVLSCGVFITLQDGSYFCVRRWNF